MLLEKNGWTLSLPNEKFVPEPSMKTPTFRWSEEPGGSQPSGSFRPPSEGKLGQTRSVFKRNPCILDSVPFCSALKAALFVVLELAALLATGCRRTILH